MINWRRLPAFGEGVKEKSTNHTVSCFAIFQRVNKWQYSTLLLEQHTAELSVEFLQSPNTSSSTTL
ncbi:hypothetical protein T10_5203 [Trichinella papuae]|uniref:Uncharacterized protein n=1 Tax=Trichinella papuae TaxID=268474 RepID=A0A0V1MEM2_9BILA|nr:hypothetical protein T10_5203 [Trichinella papuae]